MLAILSALILQQAATGQVVWQAPAPPAPPEPLIAETPAAPQGGLIRRSRNARS